MVTVFLEIGKLAAIEPEALRFCWEEAALESIAEGSRLEITEIPGIAWCPACLQMVEIDSFLDPCPRCGAFSLEVRSGTTMRIGAIEIAPPTLETPSCA